MRPDRLPKTDRRLPPEPNTFPIPEPLTPNRRLARLFFATGLVGGAVALAACGPLGGGGRFFGGARPTRVHLTPETAGHRARVALDADGAATLAPGHDRGVLVWDLDLPPRHVPVSITLDAESSPPAHLRHLAPEADIIVQIRRRLPRGANADGTGLPAWTPWWPENLLPGGDFRDTNGSGLPDKADVLSFNGGNRVLSDLPVERMPAWVDLHLAESFSIHAHALVDDGPESAPLLSVPKPEAAGQTIVQMRSDRVPPATALTVSGWNAWDLGEVRTMGLMARFHELDRESRRLDKIMFLGDDDWHQPGKRAELRWRAVTFRPREDTRRLNLYPARLIGSAGRLDAARYQVRADSLDDPAFRGATVAAFEFHPDEGWEAETNDTDNANATPPEGAARFETGEGVLTLRPPPHTNRHALGPAFPVPDDIARLAFRVEMDVRVPERYDDHDPSHKVWASTYLEWLDDTGAVLDTVQVSACRPRFGGVLAAAGERPPGGVRARVRLVASHQSYLPDEKKANMTGEMTARWRGLEVFESRYPTAWRARLDEDPVIEPTTAFAATPHADSSPVARTPPGENARPLRDDEPPAIAPQDATRWPFDEPSRLDAAVSAYQVRAWLLGDALAPPPRLHGVRIETKPPSRPIP